ncbi:hypothetical protein AS594_35270 [Streptomyces agglomeratus]|uniref:MmyB-like transcription regulator ligand binding domain-containing protein n=1 Tax=Streptomyces agglomeratus TaxID=285458 RepID=A0A1E5PHQ6_9ACTN|nr:hypothetical protein AS594_35270 [Streptomyces agglomeratus]
MVDKAWSDLHKNLVTQSRRSIPQAAALAETLQWGDAHELKRRRDDAVHASWWNADGVGVVRCRFFRKQDGANLICTFEDLEQDATLLFEYAEKLDLTRGRLAAGQIPAPGRVTPPCCHSNEIPRCVGSQQRGARCDSPYSSDLPLHPVSGTPTYAA